MTLAMVIWQQRSKVRLWYFRLIVALFGKNAVCDVWNWHILLVRLQRNRAAAQNWQNRPTSFRGQVS